MQRKSEELQLAVQEYLDVDWTSVKYYLRRQIAKCVQECKSQASNAKRIAKTLKQNNGNHSQDFESNGTCDSGEDSDDWGSDFEDSEEEVRDEEPVPEVNNNCIIQETEPDTPDKEASTCPVLQPNIEKAIPKPPDVHIIAKSANGSTGFRNHPASTIPRPPLKRPPSQPPPPPIPQATNNLDLQEDYEIPIVSTSSNFNSFSFSDSNFPSSTCSESSGIETYEIVEPPEENYEIVDPPSSCLNMTEKPLLPPRHLKSPSPISPPPLPQKPQKLKDASDRSDSVRTFSRPKLPFKSEIEGQSESSPPLSVQTNVGFISSLIGRRSSTTPCPSPKTRHRNNSFSASSPPNAVLNDSFSSSSSSPDKEGSLFDAKKMQPLPPLPPRGALPVIDDSAQNMATRPLPPVPVLKDDKQKNYNQPITQDVQMCPWYHEIEREEAEAAVKKLNDAGSFVVRPSKRAGKDNPYSLTVLHEEKLFHLNIRQRSDNTFALGKEKEKEKSFASVPELITFHLNEPILLKNRGEPAGRTILRKFPEKT